MYKTAQAKVKARNYAHQYYWNHRSERLKYGRKYNQKNRLKKHRLYRQYYKAHQNKIRNRRHRYYIKHRALEDQRSIKRYHNMKRERNL